MYCKDCLSFGVCRYASGSRLLEKEPCADFMDIDKWVKLPSEDYTFTIRGDLARGIIVANCRAAEEAERALKGV